MPLIPRKEITRQPQRHDCTIKQIPSGKFAKQRADSGDDQCGGGECGQSAGGKEDRQQRQCQCEESQRVDAELLDLAEVLLQ